jgi:hypothetical protein
MIVPAQTGHIHFCKMAWASDNFLHGGRLSVNSHADFNLQESAG